MCYKSVLQYLCSVVVAGLHQAWVRALHDQEHQQYAQVSLFLSAQRIRVAVSKYKFVYKKVKSAATYFFHINVSERFIFKIALLFPSLSSAQMYRCFLPLKSQFLDVVIHPEADRERMAELAWKQKMVLNYSLHRYMPK